VGSAATRAATRTAVPGRRQFLERALPCSALVDLVDDPYRFVIVL